jgi:hypothetical protein
MHNSSDEKFFVTCPNCGEPFDCTLAEPVFQTPIHKSFWCFALCTACMVNFEAFSSWEQKNIVSNCLTNLTNQASIPLFERYPWAVACGVTLKFNFGDFQAALRNGHELPRKLYVDVLEGRSDFVRLPGGLIVGCESGGDA